VPSHHLHASGSAQCQPLQRHLVLLVSVEIEGWEPLIIPEAMAPAPFGSELPASPATKTPATSVLLHAGDFDINQICGPVGLDLLVSNSSKLFWMHSIPRKDVVGCVDSGVAEL
jgi:hypothetical protein